MKTNTREDTMTLTKEEIKSIANRKYYLANKEKRIKQIRAWQIKTNYACEKTPEQRVIRNIKRCTRAKYPLKGKKCACGAKAVERHHTTFPVTVDDFKYVCKECHRRENKIYRQTCGRKMEKEVKNGSNRKRD